MVVVLVFLVFFLFDFMYVWILVVMVLFLVVLVYVLLYMCSYILFLDVLYIINNVGFCEIIELFLGKFFGKFFGRWCEVFKDYMYCSSNRDLKKMKYV